MLVGFKADGISQLMLPNWLPAQMIVSRPHTSMSPETASAGGAKKESWVLAVALHTPPLVAVNSIS